MLISLYFFSIIAINKIMEHIVLVAGEFRVCVKLESTGEEYEQNTAK